METPASAMNMATNIFSDMVMQEAIRDKTIQVTKQLKDMEGGLHDTAATYHEKTEYAVELDEELEGLDEEEEKIMREIRERRVAEMKNQYQEKQENLIKGHGQYTEIVEAEFLPNVTGSKFVIVHFYHKDFERCKIVDMHLREIAKQHTEAKFVYLNAENSPFFI